MASIGPTRRRSEAPDSLARKYDEEFAATAPRATSWRWSRGSFLRRSLVRNLFILVLLGSAIHRFSVSYYLAQPSALRSSAQPAAVGPLIPWMDWNGAIPTFELGAWQKRELDDTPESAKAGIRKEALAKLSDLQNATILLIGDSVDRNFVDQFAWVMQAEHYQEAFDGKPFNASSIKSWGFPHSATIRSGLNLRLANLFLYGAMDESDVFSTAADWLPPGRAEDRIEALFKPFTERLEFPVGLIQFHVGLWDLAYFGRQDKETTLDTSPPLTPERMRAWRVRTLSTIRKIKATWPGVPIVFRKLHRIGDAMEASYDYGGSTNFFTSVRIHQLRHLQDIVAEEAGIAVWDFGEAFEGFQKYQDKVHPLLWPGGILMAQALLHQLYLARTYPDYNQ